MSETTQAEKETLARSIYGKHPSEEVMDRDIAVLAAASKLKVIKEDEKPAKPDPQYDSSKAVLEKFVGGTYVRKNPGIYPGAKYTVMALDWSETRQEFAVLRDSPRLEYVMACPLFWRSMVKHEPKKPEPAPAPAPKGKRNAWSDK